MTYVKICGLTTEAMVDAAVDAGADAVGFVMCPSPRQVSVDVARRLRQRVPSSVQTVAVVRTIDPQAIAGATEIDADLLQGEGPNAALPGRLRRLVACRIDTIPPGDGWILLDGPRAGSGQPTDFDVARQAAAQRPLILAGGLSPDNVGDAIVDVRPAGVDVSSGVERQRGEKDAELIHQFIRQVRRLETNHDHEHRRP